MHIELVEVLRCPRTHEDAWLVAGMDELRDRDIVRGTLGCPACGAEYPIVDGIARLCGTPPDAAPPMDEHEAVRAAALLDLSSPGSYALLAGAWGTLAPAVAAMTDVRTLALNAPGVAGGMGAWGVWAPEGLLPFAPGSARGVALDARHAARAPLAVGVLQANGRLVAPAGTPLPVGITELARDDAWWVGERAATPRLVGLRKA